MQLRVQVLKEIQSRTCKLIFTSSNNVPTLPKLTSKQNNSVINLVFLKH